MPIYPSAAQPPPPTAVLEKTNSIPQSHNWHHSRRKYAATRHPTCLIWKRASYWGGDQKAPWASVQKGLRNSSCLFIQCRGCQRLQQRGTILSSYVLSLPTYTQLCFLFLCLTSVSPKYMACDLREQKVTMSEKGTQFGLLLSRRKDKRAGNCPGLMCSGEYFNSCSRQCFFPQVTTFFKKAHRSGELGSFLASKQQAS